MADPRVTSGQSLRITAPTGGVTVGVPVIVGNYFAMPSDSVAAGAGVTVDLAGTWTVDKDTSVSFTEGADVFWDDALKQASNVGRFIGHAADFGGSTTAANRMRVRITEQAHDVSASRDEVLFHDHFTGIAGDADRWDLSVGWAGIDAASGVLQGTNNVSVKSQIDYITRGLNPVTEIVLSVSSNAESDLNFVELGADAVDGVSDSSGPDFILRFFDNTSPNWFCQVWNAGDELLAGGFDSGVPAVDDVRQTFRTEETADEIKFFIDGVLVYTQTTKLPPLTTERGVNVALSSKAGPTPTIDLDRVTVWART